MPPRHLPVFLQRHTRAAAVAGVVLVLLVVLLSNWRLHLFRKHKLEREKRTAFVPTDYWVIGPFGPELLRSYEPELYPDPAHPCKGPDGSLLQWKQIPVVEGIQCLDFRKRFSEDNSSGYALTYICSPVDQPGTLLLGSDDTIKVWVNGQPVYQYARFRSGRPDEDRVDVHWRKGRNTLLVKVANQTGDHLFFLKCVGAPSLRATTTPLD